jgi:hypothetical protein
MKVVTWRNTAVVLAMICAYQRVQSCTHDTAPAAPASSEARPASDRSAPNFATASRPPSLGEPVAEPGKSFHGFKVPAWAVHLAPQRGETLRAYRDRILPLARMAVAPQRARVTRMRDEFASLDPRQRAELDGAVAEAATAIRDRIMTAFASGELGPTSLKPMTGVAIARDVLDIVERGNTRFVGALTPDQRTQLATHRFDFADYLVFTAPWEDALHALDR